MKQHSEEETTNGKFKLEESLGSISHTFNHKLDALQWAREGD